MILVTWADPEQDVKILIPDIFNFQGFVVTSDNNCNSKVSTVLASMFLSLDVTLAVENTATVVGDLPGEVLNWYN